MALDGIVIANLTYELNTFFNGGRISKIAQPEKDEILLTIKTQSGQKRLLLSANPSLPLVYVCDENKQSPLTAPNFCMMLRKHIANGRIISIEQPGLERIIIITVEHLDDLGDLRHKKLIIELMGKHSNIIFCDEKNNIIDSIKHISAMVSSVREVLPGREYFVPEQEGRKNPLEATKDSFIETFTSKSGTACKNIYTSYTGISPLVANELCYRTDIDGDASVASLTEYQISLLADEFIKAMGDIRNNIFYPNIAYVDDMPSEYASIKLTSYRDDREIEYISNALYNFYSGKASHSRIRQKSADLRHVVNTNLERSRKKFDLQKRQLKDTEKRDKYKVYGELIHAYGYGIEEGAKSFEALNYYTNENITIPLDPDLDTKQNAAKYFDKYNKLKRTYEALTELIEDTEAELIHLESIATALDIAESEADLSQIKDELIESGYVRFKGGKKQRSEKSKPYHYVSTDGFDIYVGKNNYQNDEITFKLAEGNDWWFHAKKIPGSHVLVKTKTGDLPDKTFEEAAALAGYYSKGRYQEKVEIDYLQKKNVKKPNKAKPGFVVYYTNYSLAIVPDIDNIKLL